MDVKLVLLFVFEYVRAGNQGNSLANIKINFNNIINEATHPCQQQWPL